MRGTYNPETWAMSPAQRVRETRRLYVSRGLCPYCYGERPAEPGKEACTPCRLERNRRYNERRRQRVEAGLCGKCGQPNDTDTQYCSRCRERHNIIHQAHMARRREAGKCLHCGDPVAPGKAHCPDCSRMYAQTNTARYRAKQASRETCTHEVWRCRIRVVGIDAGRVKLCWREWCPACRKSRQTTFLADTARFQEFVSWHGVRQSGDLQQAA